MNSIVSDGRMLPTVQSVTSVEKSDAALALISAALDSSGWIVIVGLHPSRPPIQNFFAPGDYTGACANAKHLDANGFNTYFATSTFKDKTSRKAANVNAVKVFKIDLDVAPDDDRKFPSAGAAVGALAHFCEANSFPIPVLVASGFGVHAYWIVMGAMSPDEGKLYAEKLKAAFMAHGLMCDPTVTADIARILRVPDTHNYKVEGHVKLVRLKGDVVQYDTDDMLDHIDRIHAAIGAPSAPVADSNVVPLFPGMDKPAHLKHVQADADTEKLAGYKAKIFALILQKSIDGTGCTQIKHAYEQQTALDEPRWRAGLSIAKFCDDGDDAIHIISKYHNGYTPAATIAKAELVAGPYTCQTFINNWPAECDGCPHKDKITSPIALGIDASEVAAATFDDAATIIRLAALPKLEYDRVRAKEAKALGIRTSTLDEQVREARGARQGAANSPFVEVEPWDQAVDIAELLTEISSTILRFIVCEKEIADAAALWAAMTWVVDAIQIAPMVIITAPEKRCGKSEFRRLMGKIVCRALEADGMSASVLFRGFDLWKPTLLVDEFDTFVSDDESLRGIFNAGHQRGGVIWRCIGENFEPKMFDVFGPKLLAGIGKLPGTMEDRSIIFELRRKLPGERVERLRYANDAQFETIRRKLARFSQDHLEAIRNARPELPDALNDRQQDNWEPLLAVADIAGGVWPHRARTAALKLSDEKQDAISMATELLSDIREVFAELKVTRIFSFKLVHALCRDERRWTTHNRGANISAAQVARILKGHGINSKSMRIDTENAKGYDLAQFADAFARYLPPALEFVQIENGAKHA